MTQITKKEQRERGWNGRQAKKEKTYICIGVLKAGKENSGTELIFTTIIQERVPEVNEVIN